MRNVLVSLVIALSPIATAFGKQKPYTSPRNEAWECIHSHEGAWNANTGNGYQGGLQMDYSFQRTYGPEFIRKWGGAHRWPVWAQKKAADRAYRTRGFTPWPNTARMCGLL